MDSGLYVVLAIVIPVIRIGLYMARSSDRNRPPAGFAHSDDDADEELARVIREKEQNGSTGEDQGDAAPYRASGARRPRRAPSTEPVADEVVPRCSRCDMRVSPGEDVCASCARVIARRRRPK
jgi:hypothetical protein